MTAAATGCSCRAALAIASVVLAARAAADPATAVAPAAEPNRPLHGAGATLPYPVYAAWADAYRRETGIEVQYDETDSAAGVRAVEQGSVDFGASEVPLSAGELQRRGLRQFPAVIGAVVPVIHLAGVPAGGFRLTGQVLGDIFLGRILRWDDPTIAALNPGVALPGLNITVVHRGDASGTTYVWSRYLAQSNTEWKRRFGAASRIDWPTGTAESDSDGMASTVQRTRASIGYVEFAYARQHRLNCVALQVDPAHTVAPGAEAFRLGAAAAVAAGLGLPAAEEGSGATGRAAEGAMPATAWPITAPSYILVRSGEEARPVAERVEAFFAWSWQRGGPLAADLGFTPLPKEVVDRNRRRWHTGAPAPASR